MNIAEKSDLQLEVLVSTMNRTSLDFLYAMFKNADITACKVLIINQTTSDAFLYSDKKNIRIINTLEKGLSKSRNLALQNAVGQLVLITDDDVVFEKHFVQTIEKAFKNNKAAALITFIAKKFNGNPYRTYPKKNQKHTLNSVKDIISWEIAFNLSIIKSLKLQFDENFGLGSTFTTGEEYLFTRAVIKAGETCYFLNTPIVSHQEYSSGKDSGSDRLVYARAALHYKLYKQIAYFWLIKYLFFLLRHRYIKFNDIKHKWLIGLKGITDYKKLA